jgi:hypothetical protein
MLSLAERQKDRVLRKAENMLDSEGGNERGGVNTALTHAQNLADSLAGLSEDERQEVMKQSEDGFRNAMSGEPVGDMGKYAGIGIVNPLIVPAADMPPPPDLGPVEKVEAGGGWGTANGNANGRAVEAQAGDSANNGEAVETPAEIAKREQAEALTAAQKGRGTNTVVAKAPAAKS